MARRPFGRGNYTEEEIEALVEGYAELMHRKSRPSILVRMADIDRALRVLNRRERDTVFLTGVIGLTNELAGQILGVSESAVRKRTRKGLETIFHFLNGGE